MYSEDIPSIVTKSFQDLEQIAMGKFSRVFKGRSLETEKELAVKYIHPKKEVFKNCLDEIISMKQLSHKNILTPDTYDFEVDTFQLIYSMPLGTSLRQEMEGGKKFSSEEIAFVVSEVLEGLEYAKTKFGIEHHNIKPENIIKIRNTYKSSDWGSAIFEKEAENFLSISPKKKGSSMVQGIYLSPEKVESLRTGESTKLAHLKGDVYSLGLIIVELVGLDRKEFETLNKESDAEVYEFKMSRLMKKVRELTNDERLIHLINVMLVQDAEKRSDSSELINYIKQNFDLTVQNTPISEAKNNTSTLSVLQPYFSLENPALAKDKQDNQGHYGNMQAVYGGIY